MLPAGRIAKIITSPKILTDFNRFDNPFKTNPYMKNFSFSLWAASAAGTLIFSTNAHAFALNSAVLTTNLPSYSFSPTIISAGNGGTIGWTFTVASGVNLTVYDLGLYDAFDTSLSTNHPVALWDSNSNLVAQVTILSGIGANYRSGYTYQQLSSPVDLTAGSTYYLGAFYPAGSTEQVLVAGTTQQFSPDINWLNPQQTLFSPSATNIAFPDVYNSPTGTYKQGWFGPNFEFTATTAPEPATLTLAAAGVASLLAFRRRK